MTNNYYLVRYSVVTPYTRLGLASLDSAVPMSILSTPHGVSPIILHDFLGRIGIVALSSAGMMSWNDG